MRAYVLPRSPYSTSRSARALVALLLLLAPAGLPMRAAQAQNNGAALSPPSGWSSWSFIRSNPTEANIEAQALAMRDTGLVGHGFTYLNIDDFYYLNPATTVDQYGRWVVDSGRFPRGMAAVASYVHNLGEKFGMYLTPGIPVAAYNQNTPIQGTTFHARDIVSNTTAYEVNYNFGNVMYYIDYAKNPAAAQAFLNSWANLLASYGVDYTKLDGVGNSDIEDIQHWSQALNQSGRTIHFELSNSLDVNNGSIWKRYANGWRTEGDIECYCSSTSYPLTNWTNVARRFSDLPAWVQYDASGGWGDPDSVEIGNGSNDGLTPTERQTQMSLWAISAAPLFLGSDLTAMDSTDLGLLTNDEVLGVDRAGRPAHPVSQASQQQAWWAANGDGSFTVGLFNLGAATANVTVNWSDLTFTGSATVRDLWSHTGLGAFTGGFTASVQSHGSKLLRVAPAAGATAIGSALVSRASNRCVDSPQATNYNGVQLTVFDCNGGPNQRVTYNATTKALGLEGKCFDAHNNQTAPGTHVEIYTCNGQANQQWTVNADGTITGVQSGSCLDVTGGGVSPNGTGLELWTCNGGSNQLWNNSFGTTSTTGWSSQLVSAATGRCLDDPGATTVNGTQVVVYDCNGSAAQRFTYTSGRALQVVGKCLDAHNNQTAPGTHVEIYDCTGGANQQWNVNADGTITGVQSGSCLDVTGGGASPNGTGIELWTCTGGTNQYWTRS